MNTQSETPRTRPQIWAIGGGKGGTGKSFVTASLAIHLAQCGHRVALVDGDLGGANLHTFLGMAPPPVSISDVVRADGFATLDDAAYDTPVRGLRLVSGARNRLDIESMKYFEKTRLVRLILGLSCDLVLVDLGAGTSLNVLDLFSIADRGILTIVPEPTALENCYRFLHAAFLRRLQNLGRTLGYLPTIDLALDPRWRSRPRRGDQILEEIRRIDWCAADALRAHLEAFRPCLIINQARDHQDARLGSLVQTTSERFIGIPIRNVGAIPYDPMLVRTVKSQRAFLLEYPRCATSRALRTAAAQIMEPPADDAGRGTAGARFADGSEYRFSPNPYAMLDLAPGASPDEILAAYLRLKPALRADSPALVSLDCEPQRQREMAEVEAAYRFLSRNISARPA
jgi:flagellar biosynthesis protein FlhG